MMPGYIDAPYFSPILIHEVIPLKSGASLLKLRFLNVGYAEGVQNFEKTLRVVLRLSTFLFAAEQESEDRGVVISELNHGWLERCFSILLERYPLREGTDLQIYLNQIFAGR